MCACALVKRTPVPPADQQRRGCKDILEVEGIFPGSSQPIEEGRDLQGVKQVPFNIVSRSF